MNIDFAQDVSSLVLPSLMEAQAELPYFCSYMLHMDVPEHCQGNTRWGVNGFLNSSLQEAAESSGQSSSFQEILSMYLRSVFQADTRLEEISGSSAELFSMLATDEATKELVRGIMSPRSFSTQLGMVKKRDNFPITYKKTNSERKWVIKRSEWEAFEGSTPEAGLDEIMPF